MPKKYLNKSLLFWIVGLFFLINFTCPALEETTARRPKNLIPVEVGSPQSIFAYQGDKIRFDIRSLKRDANKVYLVGLPLDQQETSGKLRENTPVSILWDTANTKPGIYKIRPVLMFRAATSTSFQGITEYTERTLIYETIEVEIAVEPPVVLKEIPSTDHFSKSSKIEIKCNQGITLKNLCIFLDGEYFAKIENPSSIIDLDLTKTGDGYHYLSFEVKDLKGRSFRPWPIIVEMPQWITLLHPKESCSIDIKSLEMEVPLQASIIEGKTAKTVNFRINGQQLFEGVAPEFKAVWKPGRAPDGAYKIVSEFVGDDGRLHKSEPQTLIIKNEIIAHEKEEAAKQAEIEKAKLLQMMASLEKQAQESAKEQADREARWARLREFEKLAELEERRRIQATSLSDDNERVQGIIEAFMHAAIINITVDKCPMTIDSQQQYLQTVFAEFLHPDYSSTLYFRSGWPYDMQGYQILEKTVQAPTASVEFRVNLYTKGGEPRAKRASMTLFRYYDQWKVVDFDLAD